MSLTERLQATGSALKTVAQFIMLRKKWWLAPLLVVLCLLGVLMVLVEGSALAPLVYTLF